MDLVGNSSAKAKEECMRRFITLVFALALLVVSVPAAGATTGTLDVEVGLAPIVPDGTVAGEITDFVLTFVDRDPAVPGISLYTGGTVTVTLPDDFVNIGMGGPNTVILLQGWPQSPAFPFPWGNSTSGNSITATLNSDYDDGEGGPGAKQAHIILNTFRNPSRPGMYDILLEIDPDGTGTDVYTGTGRVRIIPKARPSINAVSVFSGGGPPPPFNNAIYQTVTAGEDAADVGLYLWDKGSSIVDDVMYPYLGVDIFMKNLGHGLLRQGNKTVGHVWIDAPAGADDYGITTAGASSPGSTAVSGLATGILITTFHTDGDVTGDYTITLRMNNGNTQKLFVTAE
jgi:hypothetical protein